MKLKLIFMMICVGDTVDLYHVEAEHGLSKKGVLCDFCIEIQETKYGQVFTSKEPYKQEVKS